MVVFDASVLIDLFNPRPGPRKEKIDHLMANLSKEKIVIPAPAYIEFLTLAGKARQKYHEHIEASSNFRVEPLSKRASVECAILLETIFQAKQKREITKTKLKFDWMIVAIAKMLSPQCVYTCDEDIVKGCTRAGLNSVNINNIEIPPPMPVTGDLFDPTLE